MTPKEEVLLAGSHVRVSRLGFGCYPAGGHGWGMVSDEESIAAIRYAFEQGITFFDTADVYGFGHSEEVLACALGASLRTARVATKLGVRWAGDGHTTRDLSPAYLRTALHASLRRLRLEQIPLCYLHWPDANTPLDETLAEVAKWKDEGKIACIGLSNFSALQVREALSYCPIAALQVQFSLIVRRPAIDVGSVARNSGVPVVTWGSLAQGLLSGKFVPGVTFAPDDRRSRNPAFAEPALSCTLAKVERMRTMAAKYGKTLAQLALRWVLDSPGIGCALFGAKTVRQVQDNLGTIGWQLASEDHALLTSLFSEVADDATCS